MDKVKPLPKKYSGAVERKTPDVQVRLSAALDQAFGASIVRLEDNAWEYGLCYSLEADGAREVFRKLKDDPQFAFNMMMDVTAVDWMDRRDLRFEVVYQLMSLTHQTRLCLKVSASEDNPRVESVAPLWSSANFLEREVFDMYGVVFEGHGDLRRVVMYDEFVGHPLRKDYPIRGKQPRVPLRIPELRNTSADMQRDQLVPLPVRNRTEGAPKR